VPFPPSLELDDFGGGGEGTYEGVSVGIRVDVVGRYGGGGGGWSPGSLQRKDAMPLPDK
jgi:hypothetical protein